MTPVLDPAESKWFALTSRRPLPGSTTTLSPGVPPLPVRAVNTKPLGGPKLGSISPGAASAEPLSRRRAALTATTNRIAFRSSQQRPNGSTRVDLGGLRRPRAPLALAAPERRHEQTRGQREHGRGAEAEARVARVERQPHHWRGRVAGELERADERCGAGAVGWHRLHRQRVEAGPDEVVAGSRHQPEDGYAGDGVGEPQGGHEAGAEHGARQHRD